MSLKTVIFSGALFLFSLFISSFAASVDTIDISSRQMNRSFRAIIVIPEHSGDTHYPVVYLLHGWSGNYRNWFDKADLPELADRFRMLLVCPEGGYAGWYVDSPLQPQSQYESYIIQDVISYVDIHYPTIADSSGRALCGLSMGGYGALRLLARHPDKFAAAGSMSGVMELTTYEMRYGLAELLGPIGQYPVRWQNNSALMLIEKLQGKKKGIMIECGVSDRFIEGNRKLHEKMLTLNIAHDYVERPGAHSWSYWVNALDYHLLFMQKYLKRKTTER